MRSRVKATIPSLTSARSREGREPELSGLGIRRAEPGNGDEISRNRVQDQVTPE